ncbi:DUF5954 family protein [Actinomadura atramentaria]|uniref:DUF5954 family protein n=1 Tax=Actinomadura atramentaria TaxID=1990 RepID=UPI00039A6767|nr:DUF5954 family protein [Actinomadura atramentaria]
MTTGDGDAGGRLFPDDLDRVDPVAAVRFADARRAAAAYPELVAVGPLFAPAERAGGGRAAREWRIVGACDPLPQGAREILADVLADRAALTGLTPAEADAYRAAARRVRGCPADAPCDGFCDGTCSGSGTGSGDDPPDEVAAAGSRFRVVRIEQLVRTGLDGPEPPRPSDPDPRPHGLRPPAPRPWDVLRDDGPVPDAGAADLLDRLREAAAPPGPADAYGTPVALAPMFTVAERCDGQWRPTGRLHELPGRARESLANYFRHIAPVLEHPDRTTLAEYAYAAALMDDGTRRNGIEVAGRRFRIVRLERITLFGPDGPEPPRPGDPGVR